MRAYEATPLVLDGVMYTTGPWSVVYALDARTGAQLWTYDPQVAKDHAKFVCCDIAVLTPFPSLVTFMDYSGRILPTVWGTLPIGASHIGPRALPGAGPLAWHLRKSLFVAPASIT